MIASMTAFTRCSVQRDWGSATWELRSVNHRYLEIDLKLPEHLRALEMSLRTSAQNYLWRGKFECHLKYQLADALSHSLIVNKALVSKLAQAADEIKGLWPGAIDTSLRTLLTWPGVLQGIEYNQETMHQDLLQLFDESLQDLVEMRQREGKAIAERLQERLDQVLLEAAKVKQRLPVVTAQQRAKILARINEFKLTIDPQRLEEELLLLMQKMDVAEELERLEMHVAEVRQSLQSTAPVGRRLDFLMQELHREANTLGSKSSDSEVTHAAIHLKVLIEQMREQVQNVE